mgnify:CR=1 FL=1
MSNLNLATVSAKNQTYKQMSSKYVVMDTEKLCNYLLGLTSKGSPVFGRKAWRAQVSNLENSSPLIGGPQKGPDLKRGIQVRLQCRKTGIIPKNNSTKFL